MIYLFVLTGVIISFVMILPTALKEITLQLGETSVAFKETHQGITEINTQSLEEIFYSTIGISDNGLMFLMIKILFGFAVLFLLFKIIGSFLMVDNNYSYQTEDQVDEIQKTIKSDKEDLRKNEELRIIANEFVDKYTDGNNKKEEISLIKTNPLIESFDLSYEKEKVGNE